MKFHRFRPKASQVLCYPKDRVSIMGWSLGEKLQCDFDEPLEFSCDSKLTSLDIYPVLGSGLLLSTRASDMIQGFTSKQQVFDVQLEIPNGRTSLKALNLIDKYSCLNRELSKLQFCPIDCERIEFIDELVINSSKLSSLDIFRLEESYDWILVSDKFKETWSQLGFTGAEFEIVQSSGL